jgi:phosphorylcholine metabolism protein LicD
LQRPHKRRNFPPGQWEKKERKDPEKDLRIVKIDPDVRDDSREETLDKQRAEDARKRLHKEQEAASERRNAMVRTVTCCDCGDIIRTYPRSDMDEDAPVEVIGECADCYALDQARKLEMAKKSR